VQEESDTAGASGAADRPADPCSGFRIGDHRERRSSAPAAELVRVVLLRLQPPALPVATRAAAS
jgi:hypothetical protein